jgi:ADP-ribose pyrophosphatase YjhB (NUDIX family)
MTTLQKAVVIRRGKVLLARCRHDQHWELPGDLVDGDASGPGYTLAQQIRAETGQAVLVGPEVHDFVQATTQVLTFGCHLQGRLPLQISEKYHQIAWLPVDELPVQNLAPGYVTAIRAWEAHPEQHSFAATDFG